MDGTFGGIGAMLVGRSILIDGLLRSVEMFVLVGGLIVALVYFGFIATDFQIAVNIPIGPN